MEQYKPENNSKIQRNSSFGELEKNLFSFLKNDLLPPFDPFSILHG